MLWNTVMIQFSALGVNFLLVNVKECWQEWLQKEICLSLFRPCLTQSKVPAERSNTIQHRLLEEHVSSFSRLCQCCL